jgi:thymidylate synthase (FAD)
MSNITIRSDFDVDLLNVAGSDSVICMAAKVSTMGSASLNAVESAGLLNFLMKNRHGSPFEHNHLMFRIVCPIAVWREFMRHRIGFSYNEESGRYRELAPVFYMPSRERALVQVGKTGHYEFVQGTDEQYEGMVASKTKAYEAAWESYRNELELGIAKEVARFDLPVAIYSSAYVSCNARSLMSFLSLRTKHAYSKFPSYPQWEINQVADQMEDAFAEMFPLTHEAFVKNGRVAP